MDYENLLVEAQPNAVILTINRPKALNALNRATFGELRHFFTEGYKSHEPFVGIVIIGAGDKAFVAGADIKEFMALSPESASALSRSGQEVLFLIEQFHRPVIAAVNGYALGGGCELAMACHLRIASEYAKFGQPEVNLGIIPGYGGTQRLSRYVGKTKAMELLLTAGMLSAEEAKNLGLVNDVVGKEELLETCLTLMKKIGKKGPFAITKIIECVNAFEMEGVDGFSKESREFGSIAGTEDFKEGATAFIEKRKPDFTGK